MEKTLSVGEDVERVQVGGAPVQTRWKTVWQYLLALSMRTPNSSSPRYVPSRNMDTFAPKDTYETAHSTIHNGQKK